MSTLILGLLFSVSFLLAPLVFAQNSDQSSSDSGVLVSPPIHAQVSGQDNTGNHNNSAVLVSSSQGGSNSSGPSKHQHADGGSDASSDEMVVKATDLVMSQITANMKLTQDQISAVRLIIEDNIVKTRNLQLSVEKGTMNSKTMSGPSTQLTNDENQKLSRIFTPDQMKIWINIQNPYQQ